ncbi:hypothetical protein [Fictibacillus solisalsi]|uniref:hypothetical protein n=1 Tax=Fictibacillus solisalsi TaxID=459525 RepID=UPI000B7FC22C|nr:hypothetical protein [Fictibacillus solisalsi]
MSDRRELERIKWENIVQTGRHEQLPEGWGKRMFKKKTSNLGIESKELKRLVKAAKKRGSVTVKSFKEK